MAFSEVSIINDALIELGEPRINARTDNTPQGKASNASFDSAKEAFLACHFWSFAMKRVELARNATAPGHKYSYSYALPSDYIRLAQINETDVENIHEPLFQRIGDNIETNETSVKITYVYNADVSFFDPIAVKAFAYSLASKMAMILPDSRSQKEDMEKLWDRWFKKAKSVDSMQQRKALHNRDHYSGFISAQVRSSDWYPNPTTS
jgi:hypothetical protein